MKSPLRLEARNGGSSTNATIFSFGPIVKLFEEPPEKDVLTRTAFVPGLSMASAVRYLSLVSKGMAPSVDGAVEGTAASLITTSFWMYFSNVIEETLISAD